jgi:Concanavalin A-like lectin/glucanases superfamily
MAKEKDSKHIFQQKVWLGISNLIKEPSSKDPDQPTNYWYSENLNVRTDPYAITLNPATVKESGGTVTDFVKWADITPWTLTTYALGDTGNIYSRSNAGAWNVVTKAGNSHGNGLQYFYGDDYLYAIGDTALGRYGPIANAPVIIEDWHKGTIDPTVWYDFTSGLASATTNQLVISYPANTTSYPGVQTLSSYNLTGKRFFVRLVDAGNQALTSYSPIFYTTITNTQNNKLFVSVDANVLYAIKIINGTQTTIASTAYSATTHKWLAISENSGTISFETSPDGISFTAFATLANPFQITNMQFACQVGSYNPEASGTSSTFGNFGSMSSTAIAQFSNDFLTAQGGIPQNTNSLALVAASSQYATAADSASLSITGDLTLEADFYLNSLPAVSSSMVLIGKWDESGATRSYIMDIFGVSGYFGDGSDSSLTISTDTTESPIDSACSGFAGSTSLTATNASFATGQQILIHQTQGTGAGQWERNVISGYTAGTITLQTPLIGTYGTGAQVRVLKQYTNVTINSGKTYTAKAWNGTTGGILAFLANGTVTITGNISASGKGFVGGAAGSDTDQYGQAGEGTPGAGSTNVSSAANGNGGGAGLQALQGGNGGGGGGNGTAGATGTAQPVNSGPGIGGATSGSNDLSTMTFGGGGGTGGRATTNHGAAGGNGGGIIFIIGAATTITGSVVSNGATGNTTAGDEGSGGGGAGGSILIKAQSATLGASLITATGATALVPGGNGKQGGAGGDGRIVLDYLTSYTGTTSPTLNAIQDNTLVTTTTYQARLGISNDGTAFEYLTKNLPGLTTGQWHRLSIPWVASSSLATFYYDGVSIGTTTGTKTAIHDNASLLYVGAKKGASVVGSFLDGYIDDVRIWNAIQSSANIYARNNVQLTGNEGGLEAYYKLNAAATDSTGNSNTLTLHGTPSYTTSVPFVDPTTRLDIDQSFTTTGNDYDVLTSISELAVDSLSFTPANDPQKSVDLNIGTKGTGDWTVTVHDSTNTVIATKTIANANMASSGYQEFVWSTPWRIVIGKTYHMHVTSTVNDGTVISSVDDDFSKGNFHTYFQFLVTDSLFHPVIRWLNFLVIGNERYLAKWDGAFYSPNLIAFPQGTHVRCFGTWGIYLAIGVWQEAGSGTPNVYDFPIGKIYFWDGISLTFNFSIDVPEGQVNSIFGMDSDLYYYAGWKGDLLYYQGSWQNQSGSFNGTKIKRIPYLEPAASMEVYPQAMCNYQGLLYMGLAANSSSSKLPRGVYAWGSLYPQYEKSLSFEHIVSTGNKGNSVKIGMLYPVGQKLLASWKDGISYGVDVIDPTAGVYHTSGLIQPNIVDGGYIYQNNELLKVRADHFKLNTGEGIQVGYARDRETTFEVANSVTNTDSKFTTNTPSNGRGTEFQFQAKLTGTGSSTPTLLSLAAQIDSLSQELAF